MGKQETAIAYLNRVKLFVDAQPLPEETKKFLKAHPFMIPDNILEEWEKEIKNG